VPLPGAELNILDVAEAAGVTSDTGVAFVIGQTPRGPLTPTLVESYGALLRSHGARPANGVLHDAVETMFQTGLARAYVVRVVGPAATTASKALVGTPSGTAVTFTASSPGAWGNSVKVEVVDAGSARIRIVVTLDDEIVGQSPAFATRSELLAWWADVPLDGPVSGVRQYGTLTAGATDSLPVVAAASAAAGGADDAANVDADAYSTALDRITAEYGTGQLVAPGNGDDDVHLAMLEKASDTRCQRIAVLDVDPTWNAAQILSHDAVLREAGNGQWGFTVGPRVRVPSPGGGIRWVPASAFWSGRAAYTDATEGVGQPPMGANYGESSYVMDVEATYTDDEREALNEAGHIVVARVNRRPRIYGARTLADTFAHPAYKWVNGTRVVMRWRALAQVVLEAYVGRRVKGDKGILVDLSSGLNAVSERERIDGNLYGDTAAEAFLIDTRFPSINSEQSLGEGWLKAYAEIKTPPVAERVQLNLAVRASSDQITNA
jgi:hypothetical protein